METSEVVYRIQDLSRKVSDCCSNGGDNFFVPLVTVRTGYEFTPHFLTVDVGKDVVKEIISFCELFPTKATVMVISAEGTVSCVELFRRTISPVVVTYAGILDMLSLNGSFIPVNETGRWSKVGQLTVSFSLQYGYTRGGIAKSIIARSPVQIKLLSFTFG